MTRKTRYLRREYLRLIIGKYVYIYIYYIIGTSRFISIRYINTLSGASISAKLKAIGSMCALRFQWRKLKYITLIVF